MTLKTRRILLVSYMADHPYLSHLASLLHGYGFEIHHYIIARCELKNNGELISRVARPKKRIGWFTGILYMHRWLKKVPAFDFIHFHYSHIIYWPLQYWWHRFAYHFLHTIWGSDFYRTASWRQSIFYRFYLKMDGISFANSKTRDAFALKYPRLSNRLHTARFGLTSLDFIDKIESDENKSDWCRYLKLPENLPIVCLGYNASPTHQHLPVLDVLKKYYQTDHPYHLVLLLTYGNTDDLYFEKIKQSLDTAPFAYTMVTNYLKPEDLARLRLATAVLIHVPVTDQLSAAFQEALYCGSQVIAGNWLPYQDLKERGITWHDIGKMEDVGPVLRTLLIKGVTAPRFQREIAELSGWNAVIGQWVRFYEEYD
ncbi:MAG: hypothetical protein R2806_12320 [Saprospiraceae bacterium]